MRAARSLDERSLTWPATRYRGAGLPEVRAPGGVGNRRPEDPRPDRPRGRRAETHPDHRAEGGTDQPGAVAIVKNISKFLGLLRWLDGRPLLDTIEPYRRRNFEAALTIDKDGRPRYSLILEGRGKKNWK